MSFAASFISRIDWSAAWLAPYAALGQRAAAQVLAGHTCAQALNALCAPPGWPVQFVAQAELPLGTPYETFVFTTRRCPTREGLHDFFNGLVWQHFPHTKRRLNQLQAQQIAALGVGQVRGPVRDALTVFDENAALLLAPDALWQALLAKDWTRLFLDLRPLWAQSRLYLLGHALLEKLTQPRLAICAHVYRVQPPLTDLTRLVELDKWVSADLCTHKLAQKPFAHLPVLGVPGWWAANEAAGFYADTRVFRPPRSRDAATHKP